MKKIVAAFVDEDFKSKINQLREEKGYNINALIKNFLKNLIDKELVAK